MIPTIWFFYGNKTAQKIKLKNGKLHSLFAPSHELEPSFQHLAVFVRPLVPDPP